MKLEGGETTSSPSESIIRARSTTPVSNRRPPKLHGLSKTLVLPQAQAATVLEIPFA